MPKLKFRDSARGDLISWCDMREGLFTVHHRKGTYLAKMVSKRKGIDGVERPCDSAEEARQWLETIAIRIGATSIDLPPKKSKRTTKSADFAMGEV